jgi:hypothetical protein
VLVVLGAVLVLVNGALVVASFLPAAALRVSNAFAIPFALTVAGCGGSLLFAVYGADLWPRPKTEFTGVMRAVVRARVPAALYYGVPVLFVAQMVSFVMAMSVLRHGGPETIDGAYYAVNHGARVVIGYSEYVALVQAQLRLFAGGALSFSWLGLVLALASPLPPGPIPYVASPRWRTGRGA